MPKLAVNRSNNVIKMLTSQEFDKGYMQEQESVMLRSSGFKFTLFKV